MRSLLTAAFLVATAAASAAASAPARAEDGVIFSGTLKTILDRGTILIGHRDAAVPFAFLNRAGQPVGFSMDICHAIAADVAAALNRDLLEPGAPAWQTGIRIAYVAVAAEARLPMITSGQIDLECGSTTANTERAKTVAFSPTFFVAGTKLMVPAAAAGSPQATSPQATSYRDLAGKTIAVSAGTTNVPVIERLATTLTPPAKLVQPPSPEAAYTLLESNQADAIASDDILLAGLQAAHAAGRKYRIIGDYLSFEPYAIAYRRDDPAFADLVQQTFQRLAADGTLRAAYARWFQDRLPNNETLNLPMSPQLTELFRSLGQPD